MSKYTTELRFICESESGLTESKGYNSVSEIIENSLNKIFDFDFPIFDEDYRSVLETKIIKHYYTREIGLETYGLWKLKLDTKLNEIMPYYNKLYESELISFNPLYDIDYSKSHTGIFEGKNNKDSTEAGQTLNNEKNNENRILTGSTENSVNEKSKNETTNTSNRNNDSTNTSLYSDTPQGAVSIDDLFLSNTGGTYLTNARKDINKLNENAQAINVDNSDLNQEQNGKSTGIEKAESNNQSNSVNNKQYNEASKMTNTDQYIDRVYGRMGSNSSKLLNEFRRTFLNIDLMIINELNDLFMRVW